MDNLSNYTEAKFRGILRGVTWTAPTQYYIGLYNVSPTDGGGGTYVSEADREPIDFSDTGTTIINTTHVVWDSASSNWGVINGFGIFDAAVGAANLIWYGSFDAPETVLIGNIFEVDSGTIELELN